MRIRAGNAAGVEPRTGVHGPRMGADTPSKTMDQDQNSFLLSGVFLSSTGLSCSLRLSNYWETSVKASLISPAHHVSLPSTSSSPTQRTPILLDFDFEDRYGFC
jgi:hypothetical protein